MISKRNIVFVLSLRELSNEVASINFLVDKGFSSRTGSGHLAWYSVMAITPVDQTRTPRREEFDQLGAESGVGRPPGGGGPEEGETQEGGIGHLADKKRGKKKFGAEIAPR